MFVWIIKAYWEDFLTGQIYCIINLKSVISWCVGSCPFNSANNPNLFYHFRNFGYKLRIWSHLLKKSLMENFIFCAVSLLAIFWISKNHQQWEIKTSVRLSFLIKFLKEFHVKFVKFEYFINNSSHFLM